VAGSIAEKVFDSDEVGFSLLDESAAAGLIVDGATEMHSGASKSLVEDGDSTVLSSKI